MTISKILVALFLTWTAYDLNLLRRRRSGAVSSSASELVLAESELQQKKIRRKRVDVIPPWLRGGRAPVRMKVNYFSVKPRDPRFSNQRKIRRMFNNM